MKVDAAGLGIEPMDFGQEHKATMLFRAWHGARKDEAALMDKHGHKVPRKKGKGIGGTDTP